MSEPDYKNLLLQLIGSLTLCDHMGDVSNEVQTVLDRIGIDEEWEEWNELSEILHRRGVTTLHKTSLGEE